MDLEQLLDRALSMADEGDWAGMAELLRDHLGEFEDEPAVHCWLGVAERELGMEGVAYERFRRALQLGPEDPYVLATAGNGVAAFDDPDAEQALRTAALTAPDVAVARLLYGAYLTREGFVTEGLAELDAARKLDPDDAQIAYELGVARYLAGDPDGAVDAVGEATRLDSEDGWVRFVLGLMLLEAGRLDEGVPDLVEAARLRPDDLEAQLAASLAACVGGAEDLAWEMLERGRHNASDEDAAFVSAVEDRLDGGAEPSRSLLMDELVPDVLRRRLQVRP
ncbi:MAG: tetratricopeptide repeat protein [Gemmatimonadetes bacterium]|nr:tetratricopeptide repeat protein [Gemmatimonadota bacterium]